MQTTQGADSKPERDGRHLPKLGPAEWLTFGILAAALAVINIYTTLLTGWGDGGSLIAVLASVLMLGLLGKKTSIASLNLGQTMVSAGGSVGFAVATYAAVKMVDPTFDPGWYWLVLFFLALGVLGTMVGSMVRRYMVHYYFPSGTACAVIQRTVTAAGDAGKRPVRMLAIFGSAAAALTVPVKIAFEKGAHALITPIELFTTGRGPISLGVEPTLYGIGIVVGPRIGLGMLIGGTLTLFIPEWAASFGDRPEQLGDYVTYTAIAVLTLPTFASIAFAYLFRSQPVIPPGFEPGATAYQAPRSRSKVYGALGIIGALATALLANHMFGLPLGYAALGMLLAFPLCVMNGRVTGETDINPVRLVAIVILTVFAVALAGDAVALLGMALVGGTLAGMAVDMMQDYRTGYLVDGNPHHQTSVQFFGTIIGALVAIPFFYLIDAKIGFGAGSSLPAPGAVVWSKMALAFAGESEFTHGMKLVTIGVSIAGCALAFFTVWPVTARWLPSLFGIGIGLLLPFEMSAAIFAGGMIKFVVAEIYKARETNSQARLLAGNAAGNDTMLVGSAIFAASAIISVMLLLLSELLRVTGLGFFYMAH